MSAKDSLIEAAIDAAELVRKQAQARLDKIDRSVSESSERAKKVSQRTCGTAFEPFGADRRSVADSLVNNPPNKFANSVKIGSIIVTGALFLYSALTKRKSDQK